ncbi:MAG: hypothetical protein ACI396_10475 [Acutalibacteraceae bacterium]
MKKLKNIILSTVMVVVCIATIIICASCKASEKDFEEARTQFQEGISTYSYDEAEKEKVFASHPFAPTKIYVGTKNIETAPYYSGNSK